MCVRARVCVRERKRPLTAGNDPPLEGNADCDVDFDDDDPVKEVGFIELFMLTMIVSVPVVLLR